MKAQEELEGVTSDDSSDNDDDKDKGGNGVDATVAAPDRPWRPRQADWLPKPPLSAESPLTTPHRRSSRGYLRKTTRGRSAPLKSMSALPKKSPSLQKMLYPTHHSRRAESGDGLSTRAMKKRETRSGRARCESPPLAPAAYGCKDYDQDEHLVDDATIVATRRLG